MGYLSSDRPTFVVEAEFLWWTANVGNLSYGIKNELQSANNVRNPIDSRLTAKKKEEFDGSWDPGARVKMGVISDYDGWDAFLSWTYYYTSEEETARVSPFNSISFSTSAVNPNGTQTLSSTWFFEPNDRFFNLLKAKVSVLLNQFDLTQGRNFWLSDHLSVRPFMGVRVYWTRLYFHVNGSRPIGDDVGAADALTRATQKSWAIGLLAGLNTDWHLGNGFSLFGEFDFALAYGRTHVRLKRVLFLENQASTLVTRNVNVITRDSFYQLHPFGDLAIGLRWDYSFRKTLRLILDAGWEYHTILKYNELFKGTFRHETSTDLPSQRENLSMTGLVIRGRVEF